MLKNVSGQYAHIEAWITATGLPKTGDAGQITAYIEKDAGGAVQTDDVAPTEVDATNMPGVYRFTLTQAETNANEITIKAKSSTSGVQIAAVTYQPLPFNSSGRVDVGSWIGAAVTLSTGNKPDVNVDEISDDTTAPGNLELDYDGTGYAGGTVKKEADLVSVKGTALPAESVGGRDAAALGKFLDVATPLLDCATTVQAGADAALVANNLDHLVGTATGIPALPAGTFLDNRTLLAADYFVVGDYTAPPAMITVGAIRTGLGMAAADLDTQLVAIKGDTAATLLDTGTSGVLVADKAGYALASTGLNLITMSIDGVSYTLPNAVRLAGRAAIADITVVGVTMTVLDADGTVATFTLDSALAPTTRTKT